MTSITTYLWFDGRAEEAARFYCSIFPDSQVDGVDRSPADNPSTKEGEVLTVRFTLAGRPFVALNGSRDAEAKRRIREAANRSQLLRHQSLTNWVVVQRSLLHLSQMIEIIATGGRPKPTYDKGSGSHSGGSLVDRAA